VSVPRSRPRQAKGSVLPDVGASADINDFCFFRGPGTMCGRRQGSPNLTSRKSVIELLKLELRPTHQARYEQIRARKLRDAAEGLDEEL
jgi:hypothetical protein